MTQASLVFAGPSSPQEDAGELAQTLRAAGGWVQRTVLQRRYGYAHWPERRFRAAAAASQGRIIGGQRGYCLTALASVADVEHAERALLSQARRMTQRAVEIRKARNSHGGRE